MRAIESGANRLGVPPPKNTVPIGLPAASARSCARSASSASTYSFSGSLPCAACELKSQYGHFFTHHGMWTYSASGGGISTGTPLASTAACGASRTGGGTCSDIGQARAQRGERAAAVADAVLQRRLEFGGAGAVRRIE